MRAPFGFISLLLLPILLGSCVVGNTSPPSPAIPPPPAPHVDPVQLRGAESGKKQAFATWYALTPDCANAGYVTVKVAKEPLHGKIAIEPGEAYPAYPKDEDRAVCNKIKSPAMLVYYTSDAGFTGSDSVTLEAFGPMGRFWHNDYLIQVR
jgi:hypothetical protein